MAPKSPPLGLLPSKLVTEYLLAHRSQHRGKKLFVCVPERLRHIAELCGRPLLNVKPVLMPTTPLHKKMFGGLAFLIRDNMAIAASSEGGAPSLGLDRSGAS